MKKTTSIRKAASPKKAYVPVKGAKSAATLAKETSSPATLIDGRIRDLGGWRGETLARIRKLIHEADPQVVEEWKWRGVPIWEHSGIICTGESYKDYIKTTFAKGVASGKPIISTVNPVAKATVTSKMTVDFDTMGEQTGNYLLDFLKDKSAKVGTFPGPSGSGWAEAFLDGFKKAVKGKSNVTMLDDKFGDSGVAVQLGLIQNALQAYPDMNVIWGCAPAAEAAVGAVAQAGKKDVLIMSSYENQAMLDALNKGEILGFATQYPVMQGRIAIDTAVRVLEKKDYVKSAKAIPDMIAKSNIDKINMSLVLAPADFKAVYSVKAP